MQIHDLTDCIYFEVADEKLLLQNKTYLMAYACLYGVCNVIKEVKCIFNMTNKVNLLEKEQLSRTIDSDNWIVSEVIA